VLVEQMREGDSVTPQSNARKRRKKTSFRYSTMKELKKAREYTLEEKTVLNDYATTTKTVHNDSFSVVFQSLWTVLVVVG
jgi:hypothetical protein